MFQPPKERTINMPWPQYPMLLKTTSSHEEGCERFWAINTKEFIGDADGNLTGLRISEVEWEKDFLGRPTKFTEIAGTEKVIPCERVFLAMGFLNPQYEGMLEQLGVKLDGRNNVDAIEGKYKTSVEKVFAAGDMRRGQSLVVWAISEGREAARKVDEYLMGHSSLESKDAINLFEDAV
jgi:glutamate synthase (NADPH/NADH) small chain